MSNLENDPHFDSWTRAERLAREFHEAYERLAPRYGYCTREQTRHFDPRSRNGRLMIAVCGELLSRARL